MNGGGSSGKKLQSSFIGLQTRKRKDREDDAINSREHCLAGILRGLEDIGRARAYAPPEDGEFRFYQEIRKRINSCFALMNARPDWQIRIRQWHLITGESQDIKPWIFTNGTPNFGVSYAPTGYQLATVLDEIPDLLSIVRECKSHFLEINSGFSKGEKLTIGGVCIEAGVNKEALSSIWCAKKVRKCDTLIANSAMITGEYNKAVVKKERVNKITREQYLQDILQLFKKMGPFTLDTRLQVEELRLYGQIMEHVTCSIWVYDGRELIGKGESYVPIDSGSADDAIDLLATDDPITREQCLMKIVRLIEAIKSSFLGTPPTIPESQLYKEIEAQLNTELLRGAAECKCMRSSPSAAIYKQWLRFVYDLELIFLREMGEDLRQMVWSIYARLIKQDAVDDPLKIVDDYYGNCELRKLAIRHLQDPFLKQPHGLYVLDRLILILQKLDPLFESFHASLAAVQKRMDSLVAGGIGEEVAVEVSSALDVLLLRPSPPQ